MEVSKRIRHEHAELRTLAQRISNPHETSESRASDFASYERQLLDHLTLFESFFCKRAKDDPAARDSAADIKSEHAVIRKELKGLHRGDKDSHQWSAEFRRFTDRFEHLCHRHDALVAHAEAGRRSEWLDREYEQSKSRRLRSVLPSSGRGSAAAMVIGAAAAAGAAYFLKGYFDKSRRSGATSGQRGWTTAGNDDVSSVPTTPAARSSDLQAVQGSVPPYRAPDPIESPVGNPAKAPNANDIVIN